MSILFTQSWYLIIIIITLLFTSKNNSQSYSWFFLISHSYFGYFHQEEFKIKVVTYFSIKTWFIGEILSNQQSTPMEANSPSDSASSITTESIFQQVINIQSKSIETLLEKNQELQKSSESLQSIQEEFNNLKCTNNELLIQIETLTSENKEKDQLIKSKTSELNALNKQLLETKQTNSSLSQLQSQITRIFLFLLHIYPK